MLAVLTSGVVNRNIYSIIKQPFFLNITLSPRCYFLQTGYFRPIRLTHTCKKSWNYHFIPTNLCAEKIVPHSSAHLFCWLFQIYSLQIPSTSRTEFENERNLPGVIRRRRRRVLKRHLPPPPGPERTEPNAWPRDIRSHPQCGKAEDHAPETVRQVLFKWRDEDLERCHRPR